ncbi:MAG: glucokinase [Actinomycetota bacterium]|nr:glucokinase [Actinomycetota bacterium]
MSVTLGLDIGGTKVLGVALDDAGKVLAQDLHASEHGFEALVNTCVGLIDALGYDDVPVGVGAAGLVDLEGRLNYAPNIPGVVDAPLQAVLREKTGRPVIVDNDANLAALGEVTYGAAIGAKDALMVTLGTGIGGGIILNGEVLRGANGFAAEIGHITVQRGGPRCACGEYGHWEAIASGNALGRMARELVASGHGAAILAAANGDIDAVTGHQVGDAANAGDADALALLDEYADNVAIGLAGLANVLDPERIVFAGGIIVLGALLFDPLKVAFSRHVEGVEHRPLIPIVPAALGVPAGATGAAVLARRLLA